MSRNVFQLILTLFALSSVTDANSRPRITLRFISSSGVKENSPMGLLVGLVTVIDEDPGVDGQVHCRLDANGIRWLTLRMLRPKKYKLVTKRRIDREMTPMINSRIECRDAGSPSLLTTMDLSIRVQDVNDNMPVFVNRYRFSISEASPVGSILGQVLARDADVTSTIRYSIGQRGRRFFRIDPVRGTLRTKVPLDREAQDRFAFRVFATDSLVNPRTGSIPVVVMVLDVNDNRPRFVRPRFLFSISRGVMTNIGRVQAMDSDAGLNGQIRFSIDPRGHRYFTINRSTGELRTKAAINRRAPPQIKFRVIATDGGGRNASAEVVVNVSGGAIRGSSQCSR